jgi:hypothetical protein
MQRWRGLKSLIIDAVDHGSRAVERLQVETARLPFEILEQIPPIAAPVKGIHVIHDTTVAGVHGMIRLVNKVTGKTLDVVLDVVEKAGGEGGSALSGGLGVSPIVDRSPLGASLDGEDRGLDAGGAPGVDEGRREL